MEWIILLLGLASFAAAMLGEALWLARNGWTSNGRAAAYVITSDLLGLGSGSVAVFAVAMIAIMMVFGPAGTGSTAPNVAYWALLSVGVVFPFVLLVLSKRLFLSLFRLDHKGSRWAYALISSVMIVIILCIPAAVVSVALGFR
jgi:hypothetical protein